METRSRFVSTPEEVPRQEHWAIIEGTAVHHESDERSRTNPGHGYPAYTENIITYQVFFNKEEFETALQGKFNKVYGKPVMGIHVDKIYVSQTVVKVLETPLTKPFRQGE